jgi:hypothetical protein
VLLLVSGATRTLARLDSPHLGHLLTPDNGNSVDSLLKTGLPIACDNSAFSGFDPARFCTMLGRIAGKPGCRFVACPDVVGDAAATARLFAVWQPVLATMSLPVALVLQDGQEAVGVPWDRIDAVFVGGSTAFKLGPVAASLIREAKSRGLWAHCGRVNTKQRFRYAFELGCDSVDGSGFSRWPDSPPRRRLLGKVLLVECCPLWQREEKHDGSPELRHVALGDSRRRGLRISTKHTSRLYATFIVPGRIQGGEVTGESAPPPVPSRLTVRSALRAATHLPGTSRTTP